MSVHISDSAIYRNSWSTPELRALFDAARGDEWAEFGLSRFSAFRGLDELERVSVGRVPGRLPTVTILEAIAANG